MRFPALLAALAVLLGAAVLWLVFGGIPAQAAGPNAVGPSGRPRVGPALPPVGSTSAPAIEDPATEGRTEVEIALEPVAEVLPAPPLPVEVVRSGLRIPVREVRVVAGAQAPGTDPGGTGAAMVRVVLADGTVCYRRVELHARPVTLDLGPGSPLAGRVLDHDGRPVVGARVWNGQVEGRGADWVETDAEGRFHFGLVHGRDGVPLVAVAPDHAWTVVFPGPRDDVDVHMAQGCALEVGLLGPAPEGPVRVMPAPAGERRTALLAYPFFLFAHELEAVRAELTARTSGSEAARPDGEPAGPGSGGRGAGAAQTVLDGLPVGADLSVVVWAEGAAPVRSPPVLLRADGSRAHVALGSGPALQRGAVVDDLGHPIADAIVVATAPLVRDAGTWMLPPEALASAPIARTGRAGRFAIAADGPIAIWGYRDGQRASGLRLLAPPADRAWSLPPALQGVRGESSFEVRGVEGPFAVRVDGGRWRPSTDGLALTEAWRRPALLDVHVEVRTPRGSARERSFASVLAVGTTALDLSQR